MAETRNAWNATRILGALVTTASMLWIGWASSYLIYIGYSFSAHVAQTQEWRAGADSSRVTHAEILQLTKDLTERFSNCVIPSTLEREMDRVQREQTRLQLQIDRLEAREHK